MKRVKVTYIAIHCNDNKPIASASSMEDLKKGLDDYFGVEKGVAIYLGFEPYTSKYPSEYEGSYKYRSIMMRYGKLEEYLEEIKIYCVDYYPYTTYEI